MLLERNDVNPDSADKSGRTPLSWAAGNGRKEFVELLLNQSYVNPNRPDKNGRSPLSWAAKNGHEDIVGMLLQGNGAHPNTADESGQTPFPFAAGSGCGRVVQEREGSHNLLSFSGRGEELAGPLATDPSPLPEQPLKKIRRF